MSKVYGNPVWPLEKQPTGGSKLTFNQRVANAQFIAWYMYNNKFNFNSCCGIVSAIYQESECDPCAREENGPGLGLFQRPLETIPEMFTEFGYTTPRDWLQITANMYCQTKYILYRAAGTDSSWFIPPMRHKDAEGKWITDGTVSILPEYEMSKSALKTADNSAHVAGAMAIMSLHPYVVNDAYGYYGKYWNEETQTQGQPSEEEALKAIQGYIRNADNVKNWFNEQSLIDYIPPEIIYPTPTGSEFSSKMFFYLRPWWQRIGR